MAILIQKYGGTSVNTPEKRSKVLDKIIAAKEKGYDVVVVVSAMGRKGEPYATDTLLELLSDIGPNPQLRTKDLLASCGEIISTCVVAHALEQGGYAACPLTGFQAGILTNQEYTNAEVQHIDTAKLLQALRDGYIVIVAGFQGWTKDKDITTLGRGGSDTTAIALGGALGAEMVEIYTDVPGIAFTDPRMLPEAPYLKSIDFTAMYHLARTGAKVVHPRAVKTAIAYNRPFVVRSTFSDEAGTVVGKPGESIGGLYGIAVQKKVALVRIKTQSAPLWAKFALDELFFRKEKDSCLLAIPADVPVNAPENLPPEVLSPCDLITVVWDQTSDIKADYIASLLIKQGIETKGFFAQPGGGTWAIPEEQTASAVKALFSAGQERAAM